MIPGLVPRPHNQILSGHWGKKAHERRKWRDALLSIPRGPWHRDFGPTQRYRVKIRVIIHRRNVRKQLQDPTNVRASCKFLEDALVARGWAVDDTKEWIDFDAREVLGPRRLTKIRWEVEL